MRKSEHNRMVRKALSAALAALIVTMNPGIAAADPQDISVAGVWIGRIEHGAERMSASERAIEITRRLTEIQSDPALKEKTAVISVKQAGDGAVLSVDRFLVMTLRPDDVEGSGLSPLIAASQWAARLAQALARAMPWTQFRLDIPAGSPAAPAGPPVAPAGPPGVPVPSAPGVSQASSPSGAAAQAPSAGGAKAAPKAPSAVSRISGLQLVATSSTHIRPGERTMFKLTFTFDGDPQPVQIAIAWQGPGGQVTYGQFVTLNAVKGENLLENLWFRPSPSGPRYYILSVYAVIKIDDNTEIRSSPVSLVVR